MYEGFEYVSKHGIYRRGDYRDFDRRASTCEVHYNEKVDRNANLKGEIGYIERDGRSNEQLRELITKQPISIGMKTSPSMNFYDDGILTE